MLEQYQRINQAAGLNIHIHNDGRVLIHICTVTANGKELNITKRAINLSYADLIAKQVPAGSLIALNISGKGVLLKKIDRTEVIDQGNFNIVLPNAKIEDFYIQNFISGASSFISVIRKTEADKWISQLTELKLLPLILSLGAFPVEHIIPQLNIYEGDTVFNGHLVKRNAQAEWTDYHYDEKITAQFPLKIASEKIDEQLIVPYAAAFQLVLAASIEPVQAEVEYLETALHKKLTDNKIKTQGFLILIIFFILLLVNFGLLSWLNTANANLASQVSRFARSSSNSADINDQVKKKEGLLQNLGWDGGINKSELMDELAALMPQEISLKQAAINPVDIANSRLQKSLVFFDRRINITGTSDKIIPVNEWIARIKTMPWVKNIQIESYTYNNELNTGQFVIRLDY